MVTQPQSLQLRAGRNRRPHFGTCHSQQPSVVSKAVYENTPVFDHAWSSRREAPWILDKRAMYRIQVQSGKDAESGREAVRRPATRFVRASGRGRRLRHATALSLGAQKKPIHPASERQRIFVPEKIMADAGTETEEVGAKRGKLLIRMKEIQRLRSTSIESAFLSPVRMGQKAVMHESINNPQ